MFNHEHYVPILKGKAGEFAALLELSDFTKQHITPIIEIPPIPLKILKDKTRRRKTIEEHLNEFIPKLTKKWNSTTNKIFLDTHFISENSQLNAKHFLSEIYKQARDNQLYLIPVLTLDNYDEIYMKEIVKIINEDKRGICLRIDSTHIFNIDLKNKLESLFTKLNLNPPNIDIIIDYKYVLSEQGQIIVNSVVQAIKRLPFLEEWRTLTFACTSFPIDMSDAKKDDITLVSRVEWGIWKNLNSRKEEIKRIPTYGDYAISHPDMIDYDPLKMQMSASIRYTADDHWLIVKGRSTKKIESSKQYIDLCKKLIQQKEYSGNTFSWGDDHIYKCANKTVSSISDDKIKAGNPTTWRKVGTNHHLTFVTNQIANFGGK